MYMKCTAANFSSIKISVCRVDICNCLIVLSHSSLPNWAIIWNIPLLVCARPLYLACIFLIDRRTIISFRQDYAVKKWLCGCPFITYKSKRRSLDPQMTDQTTQRIRITTEHANRSLGMMFPRVQL